LSEYKETVPNILSKKAITLLLELGRSERYERRRGYFSSRVFPFIKKERKKIKIKIKIVKEKGRK